MFPVMLDITGLATMLIGGASLAGRLAGLDDHGAKAVHVFAENPSPELAERAGARLTPRLPEEADFSLIRPRIVFIADLDEPTATVFHERARSAGALIHVQDRRHLCDFHLPAILRRGKLQITVSTDGVAAGLSRLFRDHLKDSIGPEWAARVEEIAAARTLWKAQGLSMAELARAVEGLVAERGWFATSK
ncbi:MAG: precorrin-2 dehydrogenase/sirohydrochlorin ferrochelatase family protein [Candidatus Binataceae bacterium]